MSNSGIRRLQKEYKRFQESPPDGIEAHPLSSNILEWHFAFDGPEGTPYASGIYHGKIIFPSEYPLAPPEFYLCTPNGRFAINQRICLSNSGFHAKDWNPLWSVSSLLLGFVSLFASENEGAAGEMLGAIETSDTEKRAFAASSHAINRKDRIFVSLFPGKLRDAAPGEPVAERSSRARPATALGAAAERLQMLITDAESSPALLAAFVLLLAVVCWILFSS